MKSIKSITRKFKFCVSPLVLYIVSVYDELYLATW